MNDSQARALASRFIRLAPEKRSVFLQALKQEGVDFSVFPIVAGEREQGGCQLSYAQQRMWFLWQLDPESAAYNLPNVTEIRGPLDVAALSCALNDVVARHESLRTLFPIDEQGHPYQHIEEWASIEIAVEHLSADDAASFEGSKTPEDIKKRVEQESLIPFNLVKGPLLRAKLFRLSKEHHVLVVTLHHVVADGWSINILIDELMQYYQAETTGDKSQLPTLPIQYADYALWQRCWLEAGELQKQLDYWCEQLQGDQPVLQLPTDHGAPKQRSFQGARHEWQIDPHVADGLRALAQQHNTSLFTVLLAAFQVLLYRYTGETDIRVGVPVANRHRAETEGLIGCFINTQVMRASIDFQQTFTDLLDAVRKHTLEAQANQDLPFEQLVEALQPERSFTHNPLFQVLFNHQALVADVSDLKISSGLQVRPFAWDKQTTQFDLKLDTWEKSGQLYAAFTYARDVFEHSTVEKIADCWRLLLKAIVQSPSTAIGELSLLDDVFSKRILREWNHKDVALANAEPVHTLFEARAALTPDALAVVSEADNHQDNSVELQLTYRELNAQANQLARYLQALGVGPDSPVAVALERSPSLVVAILAVLKAGGAYVPLDPEYPEQRLHHMMADSGADIVLTEKNLRARLPMKKDIKVVTLDFSTEALAWNQLDEANLDIACNAANLAYIIYTSGTTGKPKGVAVNHGNLCHYLQALEDELTLPATGNFAMVSTCAADLGHTVFYGALCGGRTLHLVQKEVTLDAERFAGYMERHAITVVKMVPSHLQGLLQAHSSQAAIPSQCLILGGEACSPALVQRISKLRPGCRIINHYGPTETTVGALTHRVESLNGEAASIPLGQPLAGSCAYVVDEALNPVPTNAIGELFIGGTGLARGYCGRAAATAERFVPNPFVGADGERLYRSGDRVRRNKNDDVVFLGRIDKQIKIRGFRIEIDEIEALLKQSSSIVDAAVSMIHGEQKEPLLVAYVVPKDQALVDAKDESHSQFCATLKTELLQTLPDYMVPNHYVALARLPITANGKLDRKALPTVDAHDLQRQYRPPQTPLQKQIATVWQEVLGVERVGLDDNFFALGGHSLLITQVVTRLRRAVNAELPLRTLFEASDFEVFCQTVAEWVDKTNPEAQVQVIDPVPRDQPLSLSFAQTRQWLLWQMEPSSAAYNINLAFRIRGDLDIPALQKSFDYLMARHEIWRTHFQEDGDSAYQIIAAAQPFDLTPERLPAGVDSEGRLRALGQEPFDLRAGPLLRVKLIQLDEKDYLLAVIQHHVISDGWSMQVLVNELADVYGAFRQGQEPSIAPLSIQYADFAQWQRRFFDGTEKERQLNYWRQRLGDDHPVLELPTDFPRPSQPSFAGADHTFTLPQELVKKIEHQARSLGVTPFMWFLASFQVLLYRYSGQEQIRVGAPIANRTRLETERLVGFFVNTQVHRADITGDMTVTELLRETKQRALEAQDYQDLPFEQLVAALQPERSASYSPLFQVMFNYQSSHGLVSDTQLAAVGDMALNEVFWDNQTAQFDLSLVLTERSSGLSATFNYATDLFQPKTVERFAAHWQRLLTAMVSRHDMPVAELPMLGKDELHQIFAERNCKGGDSGQTVDMARQFEAQVEKTPNATALIFPQQQNQPEQRLTYAELNARANRLAWRLRELGIGPDMLIGVAVERSLDMVSAVLAILKAGGAYVPLDPAFPQDRLVYMADNSRLSLLVTQKSLDDRLPFSDDIQRVFLEEDRSDYPVDNLSAPVHEKNLAYMIFTSGTTGLPKGVGIDHGSLARHSEIYANRLALNNTDCVLQYATLNFDTFGEQVFPSLFRGACVIVRGEEIWDHDTFYSNLLHYGISVANLTPSLWFHLIKDFSDKGLNDFGRLRRMIVGGEAMSPEALILWRQLGLSEQAKLWNFYGPTEATAAATSFCCNVFFDSENPIPAVIPIGEPLQERAVYVVSNDLNLLPGGVAGELLIGGDLLARGYHGKPALTAERFVPDPYGEEGGGRLYRTGDLARYRSDGNIEYLGRIDHQVKIRGFRIELGEIESQLQSLSVVKEAVVLAQEIGDTGGQQLVVYVVPADSALVTDKADTEAQNTFRSEVKSQLQASLPEYMVPHQYVLLDHLPLTPNGKLDRKALPKLDGSAFSRQYEPPQTELEQQLASIWQDVLGVEQVGLNDNFFELGGHSLLATQVVSRIRHRLDTDLPLRTLFEAADLRILAQRIATASPVQVVPIEQVSREQSLPLSYAQQRQWVLWQLAPESTAYHISAALRLTGRLNQEALRHSFDAVIARHEVLRTHFGELDGELCQIIVPELSLPLLSQTLEITEGETVDQALKRLLQTHANQPFDLSQGPLLRAHLIKFGSDDHVLSLVQHHIVSDAWSMRVMVEELVSAYQAYSQNQQPDFPELPIQYADYAAWQRQVMEAGEADRQLAYWREQLGDEQPVLELPTDYPRPQLPSYRGATFTQGLPKDLSERVISEAKRVGVTPFMLLLASFQALLHRYSGQDDIRVGVPIANRTRLETERLIGFFVNTQVLRAQISPELTVNELLQQVKHTALEAQAHQDLPFEQLVEALQPERSLSTTPLFQVMFNYHDGGNSESGHVLRRLDGLTVESVPDEQQTAQFDLTLTITSSLEGLFATFNYGTDLFEAETIERLAEHWQRLLESMIHQPAQRVAELTLLSAAETSGILKAWNETAGDYGEGTCIHTLFEQQVENAPEATALIFPAQDCQPEQILTYAELNTKANQLAHSLRQKGVGPDVLVGIAVERSFDRVVGLLAILKAGGAYVPLDPEYPQERLAYIMQDSGIELLLTQSGLQQSLPVPSNVNILCLDELESWRQKATTNLPLITSPHNLAYVIYTSGSTGKPKGTLLAHRNVSRLMQATQQWFHFGRHDVWTLFHSYAFDFSVWEIFGALLHGGKLLIVTREAARASDDFYRLLCDYQVTILNQTPSAFRPLIALACEHAQAGNKSMALRHVILGGEALAAETLQPWFECFGDQTPQLTNMYGITETTVHVTYRPMTAVDRAGSPIGERIVDLSWYVLDLEGQPVPPGCSGELHVGKAGLARGYLSRPGLTAERFVPDPFSAKPGQRLYRTGDLARYQIDGAIDYLGRIDHQVKIRGFRIELGEIESQLSAQDSVKDAVVLAQQVGTTGGQQLVAYVIPSDLSLLSGDTESHEEVLNNFRAALKTRLQAVLPDYMVPNQYLLLKQFPLTAHGKLDQKALPEIDSSVLTQAYKAPQTELEQQLASVWASVLDVERVGLNDNFFELGGHSLLAMKLHGQMRSNGISTPVRTLFRYPRFQEFCRAVQADPSDANTTEFIAPPNLIPQGCQAIQPDMLTLLELTPGEINRIENQVLGAAENIQDIYPLAPLQQGILFHHILEKDNDPYITFHIVSFDTKWRLEWFIDRLNTVINRHDILRTSVHWEGLIEPVQVVSRKAPLHTCWISRGDEVSALEQLQHRVDCSRIDLTQAPLIKATAIQDEAENRWLLSVLIHHMIDDNTTLQRIIHEIGAPEENQKDKLTQPLPFRNYIAQCRHLVNDAEHEKFFTRLLGDIEETSAPFNILNILNNGLNISQSRRDLADELALSLRQQAKRYGVSPAVVFHLCWALVVSKTSGRSDVVFGTVLFGRMLAGGDYQKAVGLFINTLPFRCQLDGQDIVGSLLAAQKMLNDLLEYEHVSLSIAQRYSGLPGNTPLFTSLLNYRHTSQDTDNDSAGHLQGVAVLRGKERTNYPVSMSVNDDGIGFSLIAKVDNSIQSELVCDLMHSTVVQVTKVLTESSQKICSDLDLLNENQRSRVLHACNATFNDYGKVSGFHRLFEAQSAQTPNAPAVIIPAQGEQPERTLTYTELNSRANQLARSLRKQGVGPDVLVGIAVERSLDMVIGLLGIAKAGGAYVPLDPEYPAERLGYMVRDSGAVLVLTQQQLRARLPAFEGVTVLSMDIGLCQDTGFCLESDPQLSGSQSGTDNLTSMVSPGNLAYVIYTSGTTGTPKGVAVSHGSLVNYIKALNDRVALPTTGNFAMVSTYAADLGHTMFYCALCSGRALLLMPQDAVLDADKFAGCMTDHAISALKIVPSHLLSLLRAHNTMAVMPSQCLVLGGEPCPAKLVQRVRALRPDCQIINHYGPTEATVGVLTHSVHNPDIESASVALGSPLTNNRVYIVDAAVNPVLAEVAGEVYIGGAGLARGYHGKPAATAERFVPDPLSGEVGGRLYRSGDVARRDSSGNVLFLGRADHQIKVRGYRIEIGEIQACLRQCPQVRDAAVVVTGDDSDQRQLVAYLVPENADSLVANNTEQKAFWDVLKAQLKRTLPDYMIPSQCVLLAQLPLTTNGKLDRNALLAVKSSDDVRRYEKPKTELERKLAVIWQEVIGIERVGRNDNFFELGGHSLLSIQLLGRIRQQGWTASVKDLFLHPQLSDFAQMVQVTADQVTVPANGIPADCQVLTPDMVTLVDLSSAQLQAIVAAVPGGAGNIQDIYPLAPLQEGILFHHLLADEGDVYIGLKSMRFSSLKKLEQFIASFNQVIVRHDILRTAIHWEGLNDSVQVVYRQAPLALQWLTVNLDLCVAEQLNAYVDKCSYRVDVCRAPLIEAIAVYDPQQSRYLLQLTNHHLVSDHTTLEQIIEEIGLIQDGRVAELPVPLPFRNFVAQARLGVAEQAHEAFFTQMLGDIDEPTAPFGLLDITGDGSNIEELRQPLPGDLALSLREQAQRYGVSATSLFHLAWGLVVANTSGRKEAVFGTVLFGRMQGLEGAERALGLFVNTLPVRIKLQDLSVEHALRKTHESLAELIHHEHASLALAHRCSALTGGTPLFSTLLNYRYSASETPTQSQTAWDGIELLHDEERTNYPMALSVDDSGEGFSLKIQVCSVLDAESVGFYMIEALSGLVRMLAINPRQRVAEISILSAQERDRFQQAWYAMDIYSNQFTPVHQMFEQQVRATPDATALIFPAQGGRPEQRLSYDGLNARANQLAWRMHNLKVGPDQRVGIAVERSLDMVVAVLATLKAGAVYVPLDPALPEERLAYMADNSGLALLLTQKSIGSTSWLSDQVGRVCLDDDHSDYPRDNPVVAIHHHHLVYTIFTSGTTGWPKGVSIDQGSLAHHVQTYADRLAINDMDCVLQYATLNFDTFGEQVFPSLCRGACVIVRGDEIWDHDSFYRNLLDYDISVVNLTPSMWRNLLNDFAAKGLGNFGRWRCMILGGEAMPPEALAIWQRLGLSEQTRLWNFYGPTEATAAATSFCCDELFADEASLPSAIPIGEPLSGRKICVVNHDLNVLPQGVVGELVIGGQLLARGYQGRAALTADRFVPDPFGRQGGDRLYRSGDLARYRTDGNVEYLGRIDDQVKIRGFRIELGEIESQLNAQDSVKNVAVLAQQSGSGVQQLVAYIVPKDEVLVGNNVDHHSKNYFWGKLKERLQSALPNYMVPRQYVLLEHLPLTANGKLDRKALPAVDVNAHDRLYEAPQTELEQMLANIWQDVLGVEQVGVNDNFFELGGDSIVAIQLVSRARQQGLRFTPKDVFQYQSLGRLAMVSHVPKEHMAIDQGPVKGDLLLTPIQHWFFSSDIPDRQQWNQSVLLIPIEPLQLPVLQTALEQLLVHHDALRLRFTQDEASALRGPGIFITVEQAHALAEECLWQVTLTDKTELKSVFNDAQRSFDLARGPLMRVVLAELSNGEQRLLLVVHHLVVDGVSWRILLEDLQTAYQQALLKQAISLPFKTCSVQTWSEQLHRYARSDALRQDLGYWQNQLATLTGDLPRDNPDGSLAIKHARQVSCQLNASQTHQLLKEAPSAYRTQINDLLLTALARVIGRWSGQQSVVIQLEGHGREELFEEVDLTRTLGWFTSVYPVKLTPSESLDYSLKMIKEQLRAVPNKGLGYGVLRYLGDESVRRSLSQLPEARITFNYLGQFDGSFDSHSLFKPASENTGSGQSAEAPLGNWLSISGQVYNGELKLGWNFSGDMYRTQTIETLANQYVEELLGLIQHCCAGSHKGVTPSDFPYVNISQDQLDAIASLTDYIVDIFPLTPTQKTMLWYSVNRPEKNYYVNQSRFEVVGLNPDKLRQSWYAVVDTYEVLRSRFFWKNLPDPVRVVIKQDGIPFTLIDWQSSANDPELNITHCIDELAFEILDRDIAYDREPLLRLDLVSLGNGRFHIIYTNHHLLLDGWSASLVMANVFRHYFDGIFPVQDDHNNYKSYLEWLGRKSLVRARSFWLEALKDLTSPTLFASKYSQNVLEQETIKPEWGESFDRLGIKQTEAIKRFAKQEKVTVNTLVQGAWMLLLHALFRQDVVSFGSTVSGRPSGVKNIDRQVGLFINTIPVVAKINNAMILPDWLREVQEFNSSAREFEYVSTLDIKSWVNQNSELFDSVIVFENYPNPEYTLKGKGLEVLALTKHEFTHYSLTLLFSLGEQLSLHISYARQHLDQPLIEHIVNLFWAILSSFPSLAEGRIKDVMKTLEGRQAMSLT